MFRACALVKKFSPLNYSTSMAANLNKNYFEKLLRKTESDNTITILYCEESEACEKGTNFLSIVSRFAIRGFRTMQDEKIDYQTSLIVKRQSENVMYLGKTRGDKAFENEVIAFNKIIPKLNNFLPEKLALPVCLHADEKTIVIEDLCVENYKKIGKGQRFTLEQSKLVLKEMAKLHASSIALKIKEPNAFSEITKDLYECIYRNDGVTYLLQSQDINLDVAIKLFETYEQNVKNKKALKVLNELKGKTSGILTDLILKPRKYSAINHGDVWSSNVFFKDTDSVKLIDLQMMRCSSVAADLCYCLYINMHPDELHKQLDYLLQFYHKCLQFNLHHQNIQLDEELSLNWLKNEMKEFELFGFMCAIWLLPTFYWKQEDLTPTDKNLADNCLESAFAKMTAEHKELLTKLVYYYIA